MVVGNQMKTEIRSNGSTQIRLQAERPIERVVIDEIVEAISKGQTVNVQWVAHPPEAANILIISLDTILP